LILPISYWNLTFVKNKKRNWRAPCEQIMVYTREIAVICSFASRLLLTKSKFPFQRPFTQTLLCKLFQVTESGESVAGRTGQII
jgi:hypothetical protein